MTKQYKSDSIITLKPLEGIRTRLSMYLGSQSNDAIIHVVKEFIGNSIDEYLAGYGSKLEMKLNTKDNSITVRDYGRGIPLEKVDEVATNTHSGGKFKAKVESGYEASLGLNGLGLKTATATGLLEITSYRDKRSYHNHYTWQEIGKGVLKNTKEKDGTLIKWKPDSDVVDDNTLYADKIEAMIEAISYVVPGFEFILYVDDKKKNIKTKHFSDFLTDYIPQKEMLSPIMSFSKDLGHLKVDLAMVWTKGSMLERSYVNLSDTKEGGNHVSALKATLTREINKALNYNFIGEELRRGWSFIISVETKEEVQFTSQAKTKLNMPSLTAPLSALLREEIVHLIEANKAFFEKLKNAVEKARKHDATEAMLKALTKSKSHKKSISDITDKYKGCSNNSNIELFLAEGQSAGGGLALTKSNLNQAVYSLRGKFYNSFDKDLNKVLENAEVKGLIEVLGEEQNALNKFDKIILATDADHDGVSIVVLLLGFFATFYPSLLHKGKVYIPILPKYTATDKNGKRKYLFNEKELEKIPKSWDIGYLKGLGESNPEELAQFTVNDKTRKLNQIKIEEKEFDNFYESLQIALGKKKEDVAIRREMLI